jgi:hypothetical protein
MWKALPGRPQAAESARFLALCVSDGARPADPYPQEKKCVVSALATVPASGGRLGRLLYT